MELREPLVMYGKKEWTIEEYLEFENDSLEKNEYYMGQIYPMYPMGQGASNQHNDIYANLFRELAIQLKGKRCGPFGSDVRVHIPGNGLFTYPDIVIFCDPLKDKVWDKDDRTFIEPTIIIEILAPRTKTYDRATKFELYKEIPTLKEYIMVDSTCCNVEAWRINYVREWGLEEYKSMDDILRITTIKASIPFKEIYQFFLAKGFTS